MGTPYYHTAESVFETIKRYKDLHGFETIEEAIEDMASCYDDLDAEDKSAYDYTSN
jgi:hypothetical protein